MSEDYRLIESAPYRYSIIAGATEIEMGTRGVKPILMKSRIKGEEYYYMDFKLIKHGEKLIDFRILINADYIRRCKYEVTETNEIKAEIVIADYPVDAYQLIHPLTHNRRFRKLVKYAALKCMLPHIKHERYFVTDIKIDDQIEKVAKDIISTNILLIDDTMISSDFKVLNITHKDTDAVMCDLSIRSLFRNVITRTWDYNESVENLQEMLKDMDTFNLVFITDINIKSSMMELRKMIYGADNVIIIDHHFNNYIIDPNTESLPVDKLCVRYQKWDDTKRGYVDDPIDRFKVALRSIVRHDKITVNKSVIISNDRSDEYIIQYHTLYDNNLPSAGLLTFLLIERIKDMLELKRINVTFTDKRLNIKTRWDINAPGKPYLGSIPELIAAMSRWDTFEFEDIEIPAINRSIMNQVNKTSIERVAIDILKREWLPKPDKAYDLEYSLVSLKFMRIYQTISVPGYPELKMAYVHMDDMIDENLTLATVKGFMSILARNFLRKHRDIDLFCWEDSDHGSVRSIDESKITAITFAAWMDENGGGHVHAAGWTNKKIAEVSSELINHKNNFLHD